MNQRVGTDRLPQEQHIIQRHELPGPAAVQLQLSLLAHPRHGHAQGDAQFVVGQR